MKTLILISVLGSLLVASVVAIAFAWTGIADTEISGHGILALVLGVTLTLALGIGLMFLVFYSSRHGYDDETS